MGGNYVKNLYASILKKESSLEGKNFPFGIDLSDGASCTEKWLKKKKCLLYIIGSKIYWEYQVSLSWLMFFGGGYVHFHFLPVNKLYQTYIPCEFKEF